MHEMVEDHREIYNAALEHLLTLYKDYGIRVSYYQQVGELKHIRDEFPHQKRWAFNSQQMALARLENAMHGFYRRVRSGENPGFPRFKGFSRYNSIDFPNAKNGARWDTCPELAGTRMFLKGIGHVRVKQHRKVEGKIKTITVKRDLDQWYVNLVCEGVPRKQVPETRREVGIDMGVAHFLTTSDGEHVENHSFYEGVEEKLAAAHQRTARRKKGSNRQRKAKLLAAKLQRKTRRQRDYRQHQVANSLIERYAVISREDLAVTNIATKPKPKENPERPGEFLPNGREAKRQINKKIMDAAWASFFRKLEYKAECAGRTVVVVNPMYTSQTCSKCGEVDKNSRKSQAQFDCVKCGIAMNADVNAAQNILLKGRSAPSSAFC